MEFFSIESKMKGNKVQDISDTILNEFVTECNELTQRVTKNLNAIDRNEQTDEVIDELYRDMHTIKGNAQLFGFNQMGEVAHAMETCLDPVRREKLKIPIEMTDILFKAVDVLVELLQWIESQKKEPDFKEQINAVVPKLMDISLNLFTGPQSSHAESHIEKETRKSIQPNESKENIVVASKVPQQEKLVKIKADSEKKNPIKKDAVMAKTTSAPSLSKKDARSVNLKEEVNLVDDPHLGKKKEGTSTIRVQVGLLDSLMNLVGEMVLVRNQVSQYSSQVSDMGFQRLSQRLNLVTSELQGEVMKTRMQPIGNVLETFQRVVRDLAKDLNKKIVLNLQGKETELDKTLLEAIKDPLTHIVRNSADHGIETPDVRIAAGKPEHGTILIKSYHEGGQVIVEIIDDGKGLNRDKILERAIDRGLVSPEIAKNISDRDVFNFIFHPGFSTAEKVTTVSGRGVGMDVVKTNIEKIGGVVELLSTEGKGATTRLKIPLTLAVVPALLVKSANESFAIPQVKLVELVRVENKGIGVGIEILQGKPMYRLRGELLPLVNLKEVLKLNSGSHKIDYKKQEVINIAVLNADDKQFGLIVDQIQDSADIVVKPLSQFLKVLPVYSGATIMGDGSVSLILDVMGITQCVNLFTSTGDDNKNLISKDSNANSFSDRQEFLLVRTNSQGLYAIPLVLVSRLEDFRLADVEQSGDRAVIRYRNSILPLLDINSALGFSGHKNVKHYEKESVSVVVVQKGGVNFGLVVNEILDVINIDTDVDDTVKDRPGILGNIVHNNQVVVVIDALRAIELDGFQTKNVEKEAVFARNENAEGRRAAKKVLIAEDSSFFRRLIVKIIAEAGYQVFTACDGVEAKEFLQSNTVDIVVTDIEMPHMNGWELAEYIRSVDSLSHLPLMAVTTRFSKDDIEKGKQAGFDIYQEKLNGDLILNGIDELIFKNKAG